MIDQISEGYNYVDNGDGLYRRVLTRDGRTIAYLYPRSRGNHCAGYHRCYSACTVKVVWASPIDGAPDEHRRVFSFRRDANNREYFLARRGLLVPDTETSVSITEIRALLAWSVANPVALARRNRPRGPVVGLQRRGAAAPRQDVTPPEHRRWGIEVEFFGVSRHAAERAVSAISRSWRVKFDGSVTRYGGYVGLEVVSPIIGGDPDAYRAGYDPYVAPADAWDQLTQILAALRAEGARVDKSCGVHVHMECRDVERKGVKRFVNLWANNQDAINLLVPASRRDQTVGYVKRFFPDDLARYNSSGANWRNNRYWVVNPCAYIRMGTVEVRQHAGTLQPGKLKHWVAFCLAMMHVAAQARSVRTMTQRDGLVPLLEELTLDADTREWLTERAVDFGGDAVALYGDPNRARQAVAA